METTKLGVKVAAIKRRNLANRDTETGSDLSSCFVVKINGKNRRRFSGRFVYWSGTHCMPWQFVAPVCCLAGNGNEISGRCVQSPIN